MAAEKINGRQRAESFLGEADKYRLGTLVTEQPHPKTQSLSHWAEGDLVKALETLKELDVDLLKVAASQLPAISQMNQQVRNVLEAGGRVFICGCGATGRLALTVEHMWREKFPGNDSVQAFMAGGDTALVHSIEGFEDYPEYGARHLEQMGFASSDLLISTTEGGETPYVIGATERASEISKHKPYFLYCNPDDVLVNLVKRSKRVIENSKIEKINLTVGPMALAGSTRMQAATILQLAVGLAILSADKAELQVMFGQVQDLLAGTANAYLAEFIKKEAEFYRHGQRVLYQANHYAITVFTDTTERAPTFSLMPFENETSKRSPSLSYILIPETKNRQEAWQKMLLRSPRPLGWAEVDAMATNNYLQSFDFSEAGVAARQQRVGDIEQARFVIDRTNNSIRFALEGLSHEIAIVGDGNSLAEHLLVKTHLNMHSTLVMGRLGRYTNNLMTWVYPNNGKLIDRAVRYILYLLHDDGYDGVSYSEATHQIFTELQSLGEGEAVVPKAVASLKMSL